MCDSLMRSLRFTRYIQDMQRSRPPNQTPPKVRSRYTQTMRSLHGGID
ncbi:hypothetical protein [Microcoleus sp. FACHB-SPT15]|nr:hypothetical protein [Microcoleus sp. FACHB-SPT15]